MTRTRQTLASLLTGALFATASFAQTAPSPHAANPLSMPGSGAIPAGHPSMDQLLGLDAATKPAAVGSLTVQIVPGTAGAALSADDPVTVTLYHRGSPVQKIDAKLDASGKVVVANFPVAPPVQALVSVKHGGLYQQVVSPELNAEEPIQSLQMKVFETTDERPDWSIAMQHMIVQWNQDGSGATIIEMLSASTPGDKAWLGEKNADKRITMTVPLPPGADQVELGGSFDEDASSIVDGKLVSGGALFPGRSEYRITYTVAAKGGNLELPITTPAAVENLIVFVPADDVQVTATGGLSGGKPVDMGEGSIRMFRGQKLAAGETATLSIKGIKAAPAPGTPGAGTEGATVAATGFSARNVAMGGAFLIALIGAGMILIKKPQEKTA
jgi:hypothetical protein